MTGKSKHKKTPPLPLPGELPIEGQIKRMIRVDHAGEYGAARIYDGQLAVLGEKHPLAPKIRHMADQEQNHLDTFDKLISERGVRPTARLGRRKVLCISRAPRHSILPVRPLRSVLEFRAYQPR